MSLVLGLEWRVATRDTVSDILHHPIYAGYYCFGRRQADPRRRKAGQRWSGRVLVTPEEYLALIPDKVPAYITRERYDANQRASRAEKYALASTPPPTYDWDDLLAHGRNAYGNPDQVIRAMENTINNFDFDVFSATFAGLGSVAARFV